MRFFVYFLSALFIFTTVSSKEFRIDFSDEGMKLLKKRGFGKKTKMKKKKFALTRRAPRGRRIAAWTDLASQFGFWGLWALAAGRGRCLVLWRGPRKVVPRSG